MQEQKMKEKRTYKVTDIDFGDNLFLIRNTFASHKNNNVIMLTNIECIQLALLRQWV